MAAVLAREAQRGVGPCAFTTLSFVISMPLLEFFVMNPPSPQENRPCPNLMPPPQT